MEGGGVYDDSRVANVLLKRERVHCTFKALDSLWIPNSPSSFNASVSMVSHFEENKTEKPFIIDTKMENFDEEFDDCFHRPEKKRRLTPDQVRFLEKSFELDNNLEPDRKIQLAKELGLQPRQVAIWFQNRRARYKTKVLEKEYDSLQASFDKVKAEYDTLLRENERMKNEVHLLTEKLVMREKRKPETEVLCDPISPLKKTSLSPDAASEAPAMVGCKQELDASSSARSDVLDTDSSHWTETHHSAALEAGDSSVHVFEPEVASDEDDSLWSRGLFPSLCFLKVEGDCCDDLQPNLCNLGFPVQDQGTWLWQY